MLISVVTPVLNGAKTIERTLSSLSKQRAKFEHIVMDGGSTDSTEEIVQRYAGSYSLRYFRQTDKSVFEGLWNGIEKTSGDIIGNIFADDFYLPCTLATVAAVFENNPDVQWITGIPSLQCEESGVVTTYPYAPIYLQKWIRRGFYAPNRLEPLQHESIFWRRSLWENNREAAHQILLKYRFAAEFHMWRLFAQQAELRTVAAAFACFSVSPNQISRKNRDKYLEECGFGASKPWSARAVRIVNRWGSAILGRRVIYPPQPII